MKIYDFLTRDVKAENESKKVIVSLRLLYVVLLIAFVLNMIWAGNAILYRYGIRAFLLLAIHVVLFALTYRLKTRPAFLLFNIYLYVWTLLMIPCLGWPAGLQNYLIIPVILFFYASHLPVTDKVAFSLFVLAGRILLFYFYRSFPLPGGIDSGLDYLFENTNVIALFACVILIAYHYSREDNEAEDKLMKYNRRLKAAASTDPLTGLYNRRYMYEHLQGLIALAEEAGCISVAMGDIDFFKTVNDTYGHDAGDEVLKAIANVMREVTDPETMIARWGGEEFLLVFPNTNGDQAYVILEKLRNRIGHMVVKVQETEIHVTMTFGLAELEFSEEVDTTIKQADEKLYQGKTEGRNQVVY